MFKNYLTSALRNILRGRLYTFISIFCLAAGITGALLISLYVSHELSYDTHHEKHADIYRIEAVYQVAGGRDHLAITAFPLGPALMHEYSEVKAYVRFFIQEDMPVRIGDRIFTENQYAFTDSTVFDVFTHHFVYGQKEGALSEPNTAVLTRSLSEKYFGGENPVGQSIEAGIQTYMVTAVIEDLPENSHLRYQCLLSIGSIGGGAMYSLDPNLFWNINYNYTYVLLHPGNHISSVIDNMEAFHEKYLDPFGGMISARAIFEATPLRGTHFKQISLSDDTVSRSILAVFSIVAMFLIIIAAVNYTNLATARAGRRAREIGMRKVAGATRKQLLVQFLMESLLVAFFALIISLLLVELILPLFNTLAGKTFHFKDFLQPGMIGNAIVITILTGLVSGVYPAVFLSRIEPALILKGSQQSGGMSGTLRKTLVVFQFAISIMMVAATFTVNQQLHYLQNKDLGFAKNARVVMHVPGGENRRQIETLEHTILQHPDVTGVTRTAGVPGSMYSKHAVRVSSGDQMTDAVISINFVGHNYLTLMEIPLIAGRDFDREQRSEAGSSALVNEAAVRMFGWQDNPVGQKIQYQFDEEGNVRHSVTVVGVMKDHHFLSLQHPIEPLMLEVSENLEVYENLIISYREGSEQQITGFLDESWRAFDATRVPNIRFIDQHFRQQYSAEERQGKIFASFALLCILISFIGLFGLASYTAEQRRREIGIRKVLGSSGWQILILFYREFVLLIAIAYPLAAPVAWLLMERWLQGFAYRIGVGYQPILLSGLLALGIAILTVSYHTFMSSRLNPAEAIRSE
jgi:putative ABC transport system permease protein